jgi:caa(3)-type oxidase subunit IV
VRQRFEHENSDARREGRGIAITWAVLLGLLLLSWGSAYLPLGRGNLLLGLAIAALKIALVGWRFMHLRSASATIRATVLVGVAAVVLLLSLSGLDDVTRPVAAVPVQPR